MSGVRWAMRVAPAVVALLAIVGCDPSPIASDASRSVDAPRTSDASVDAAGCGASPFTGMTRAAATCEQRDVQSAIDAAQDGDTITIPAGHCSWTTPVQLDARMRSLRLRGAGDATIIGADANGVLHVESTEGHSFAVSGMRFDGGTGDAVVTIGGTSTSWRVHHVTFTSNGVPLRIFRVSGATYGVIDHCTATSDNVSEFITVDGDNWASWSRPVVLGDANAVYIEDNDVRWAGHWEGRSFYDSEFGGRAVIRFNRTTNSTIGGHGFDSGGVASALRTEVYGNEFTITDSVGTWSGSSSIRGGTGVFYDNVWNVGPMVWFQSEIHLRVYRRTTDPTALANLAWPACDGREFGLCDNVDAHWNILRGDSPHACESDADCEMGTCHWRFCSLTRTQLCAADSECPSGETCTAHLDGPGGDPCFMEPGYGANMQRAPFYEWNNVMHGSANITDPNVNLNADAPLMEGREFFNDTEMPGYTPLAHPHPLTCVLD